MTVTEPIPKGIISFCCVEEEEQEQQQREAPIGRIHDTGSSWFVKFDNLADLWRFLKEYDEMKHRWDTLERGCERPSYRIKEIIYERNMVKLLVIKNPWESLE